MNVNGKGVVVTGAGSGMGRELTLQLVERGAKVAAADINEETLRETRDLAPKEKREQVSIHVVNIADKDRVDTFPQEVVGVHGAVDMVINNAGIIQPFVKVNDLDFDAIERVMHVNFYGTLYMTKAFLPYLLERPEAHIANVSSMGGFLPVPGQSLYGASKAAVKLFTEGLAAELADTSVHVTVVFPGSTATNITENSGVNAPKVSDEQMKKFQPLPASEAASIILDGIEKNKTRVFVGKDSKMLDRLYRLSPHFATNLITKQMKSLLS